MSIEYVMYGTPKDLWWIGFDCGHSYDLKNPRSLSYVRDECCRLAEQLDTLEYQ